MGTRFAPQEEPASLTRQQKKELKAAEKQAKKNAKAAGQAVGKHGTGAGGAFTYDDYLAHSAQKDSGNKRRKIIWTIVLIVSIAVFAFAAVNIVNILKNYQEGRSEYDDLASKYANLSVGGIEEAEAAGNPLSLINFDELAKENPDIVAWIYVPDLDISYPIVQTDDNETYLYKTFSSNTNTYGTPFLDYENSADFSDDNMIIYGHHMKDGSVFAPFDHLTKQEEFDKYKDSKIYILTPDRLYVLKMAATYLAEGTDEGVRIFNFDSRDSFISYVTRAFTSAQTSNTVDLDNTDQLFSIVTCSYQFDDARTIILCVDASHVNVA